VYLKLVATSNPESVSYTLVFNCNLVHVELATDWLVVRLALKAIRLLLAAPDDTAKSAVAKDATPFVVVVATVQFCKSPLAGVPKTGDTKVGLVFPTKLPDPVTPASVFPTAFVFAIL
jgi:hypothetical protein